MQKISIRRPIGSTKVGDVIDGIGTVEEVFAQGDKDIRIVRHGDFGVFKAEQIIEKIQERTEPMTQNVEMSRTSDESIEDVSTTESETTEPNEIAAFKGKARKREKLRIAREKASKELLDQGPNVDNDKQLLRG